MVKIHICSECCCNWKDIEEAKYMIFKSKLVGADSVKFQVFEDKQIRKHPRYKELKETVIMKEKAEILFNYGKKIGIDVFFTPFYKESVAWIDKLGVKYFKIRECDNGNKELLDAVLKTGKLVVISGQDIKDTMCQPNMVKLYCVPKYPPSLFEIDLNLISKCGFNGYSCHYSDVGHVKLAIDKGARWIELHMKLDEHCVDANVSFTFDQLKEVVDYARRK